MTKRAPLVLESACVVLGAAVMVATASCAVKGGHILAHRCSSNLKQIGYACHLYSADWGGTFPTDLDTLFSSGYLRDRKLFRCVSFGDDGRRVRPGPDRTRDKSDAFMSYCYVAGLTASDPGAYVLAFDEESNHEWRGVNVLYVNGKVEWVADIAGCHSDLKKQAADLTARGRAMKVIRPSWSKYSRTPARADWRSVSLRTVLKVLGALVALAFVAFGGLIVRAFARKSRRGAGTPRGSA